MQNNQKPIMSRELLQRVGGSIQPQPTQPTTQSQLTFAKRAHIEQNRQHIGRYGESLVGSQPLRAEVRQMGTEMGKRRMGKGQPARQLNRMNSGQNRPSAGFCEPPARQYNPYG